MRSITLPVYKRPDRLKTLTESLRRNKVDGYTLFVSAEPGSPEILDLVNAIDFLPVKLKTNEKRLGLNDNIKSCLRWAMSEGSEFNVALEEDVVLSPDAFDLADWFRNYKSNWEYASLGFFAYQSFKKKPLALLKSHEFRSWGYCFTRESWDQNFVPALEFEPEVREDVQHRDMWDFKVQFYFMLNNIPTLHPLWSRSNHTGIADGTNEMLEIRQYFQNKSMSDGSISGDFHIGQNAWQLK